MQLAPLTIEDKQTALLGAAKQAFAEKGFDGASMQDLARAAGMSAGNFYRYFPSKNAIVAAMVEKDLAEVKEDFEKVLSSSNPGEALVAAFERRIDAMNCSDGPLWAEIDAAASRKPEIAAAVTSMEAAVTEFLTIVFTRISGRTIEDTRNGFAAECCFLMMLYKGAALWVVSKGYSTSKDTRYALRGLILQTIRQTIADIAAPKLQQVS